jgi:hypothetical protein
MRMSENATENVLISVVGLIVLALLVNIAVSVFTASQDEWQRGWCEARGGEIVTTEICNVDGKIVEIPNREIR